MRSLQERINEEYLEMMKELLERKATYEYGCAMAYFDFPKLKEIQSKIDDEDVLHELNGKELGLEDEPHVTLLYGLHDDKIDSKKLMEACKKHKLDEIELGNVSMFDNPNFDVLKFDATSEDLIKCNEALCEEFPYTNDFPDYHAHCTIAYLKKGKAKKYIEMFKEMKESVSVKEIVYSRPNGTKVRESLK